jgi:hypothetical protein
MGDFEKLIRAPRDTRTLFSAAQQIMCVAPAGRNEN